MFGGLVALQHLLRPDLPPAERFVSEYARGSTAPVQVTAFMAWAASLAACVVLAARLPAPGRRPARAVTVAALAAATAGALLAAAFVTQTVGGKLPEGVRRTAGGRLHDLGTLLILAGLVVAALASVRVLRGRGYRTSVLVLAVALLAVVPVLATVRLDAPGLGQRGFLLVGCLWQWRFVAQASGGPAARAISGRGRSA